VGDAKFGVPIARFIAQIMRGSYSAAARICKETSAGSGKPTERH